MARTSASKPVRIGFIGAGGIAQGHFKRLGANPDARVVALCDTSQASIRRMVESDAAAAKCSVYEDWREMLDRERLDAVQIHTPHTLHFEEAMEAVSRGLHVLCEKPMVCSVAHAKELIPAVEQAGIVFSVSYQRHHSPEFRYVRELVSSGRFGAIHYIQGFQSQEWYKLTQGSWRQDPALSGGGQLNDSGSHLVDIILWTSQLVPASVTAFVDNLDTAVDILTAAAIRFTNGALGTLSVVGHSVCWWEDLTWFFDRGAVFTRNGALTVRDAQGKPVEPVLTPGSDPDTNWIDTIRGRAENAVPPVCGLRTIQLTEAAWESARSGRPADVVFDD